MPTTHRKAADHVIKRYGNRKLYDTRTRRYVTLEGLARRIGDGGEIRVVDQPTGEDITRVVLGQVMLEGLRQRSARIPTQVLTRLVAQLGLPLVPPAEVRLLATLLQAPLGNVTALELLGQNDLFLATEQWRDRHLLQVQADRVMATDVGHTSEALFLLRLLVRWLLLFG